VRIGSGLYPRRFTKSANRTGSNSHLIMRSKARMGQRRKFFLIAIATLAVFEVAVVVRNLAALAQLNPAPVVVPGGSGIGTSGGVSNPSALLVPATVPTTVAAVAPGAPAALATSVALPFLNPAPVVIAAAPTPAMQSVFRCSCFGTGLGVQWIGQVQATSFIGASQAAVGQCSAYVKSTGTQSPYINPPSGVSFGRSPYPSVNPNLAPGNAVAVPRNPVLTDAPVSSVVASETGYCGRCACN
jgi:hypothetical protein